jgi:hypothetical protein
MNTIDDNDYIVLDNVNDDDGGTRALYNIFESKTLFCLEGNYSEL